jgi:Ca2+/Na+ antiporter
MIYPAFIIGLILALVFSLIFSLGFRKRNSNINIWIFFLIIFLTVTTAGLFLAREDSTIWNINWSYLFFIALLVSILLAAKSGRRRGTIKEERIQIQEEKRATALINIFLWIAIALFLIVVIIKVL